MEYNYANDMYYPEAPDGSEAMAYQFGYEQPMFAGEYAPMTQLMTDMPLEQAAPPAPRSRAKKPGKQAPQARAAARPKTPWTAEQNLQLFRTMAEYIYVDKHGMELLAMYLNPSDLDHIEQCEQAFGMTDSEIAISLGEQEAESNPSRHAHLLFGVLRHMQRASGDHSIRVVNEKVKNVRSRILNRFITMNADGSLPPNRPVRYVAAMLHSLVTSPFCPVREGALAPGVFAAAESKHDVSQWLQAMLWLHPRGMYEFLVQCAVQAVRRWAGGIPPERRTGEDHHVLTHDDPDVFVVIEELRRMVGALNDDSGKGGRDGASAEAPRKRKLSRQDVAKKKPRSASTTVATNDGEHVSLAMFDLLKTDEKLQVAGKRVKLLAAVGGVVRNGSARTRLDAQYHVYRLWTCVARLAQVNQMLVPAAMVPSGDAATWPRFAEFVVVHDYRGPFDIASVEPRLRVSKRRVPCADAPGRAEELIAQWVASTEGEARAEIPMWLAAARRADGKFVLGLVVCAPDADAPAGSLVADFRPHSDAALQPVVDAAVATGGSASLGGAPMSSQRGLDPWPSADAEGGSPVTIDVGDSAMQLVVSSAYAGSPNVIDPWCEPRIMPAAVFARQKDYAAAAAIRDAPTFDELLRDERASRSPAAMRVDAAPATGAWPQMPAMALARGGSLAIGGALAALTPQGFAGLHDPIASVAALSAYPSSSNLYDANGYAADAQHNAPLLDAAGSLLVDPSQHLHVDVLNGYADGAWPQSTFDPNSSYPQIFHSAAPSEYGPP
ncbi:hypothetical protein LPJ63_003818 [Coemansia sp. RSA 2711]|nr:hypothetical protein LPJ63_003818 [Coemansia sp. RSA 2711]KAJ2311024.1 hypothetical protein IWW54_002868 [Coemansia sp. RSA 2705]KAJ2311780.1 hypothetical protein IWW52_005041 [Coemansia sp. RSA 2704]KAJ2377615.1 hypothetical protein H4S02_007600 [Coemansia sp. RSA 2611]